MESLSTSDAAKMLGVSNATIRNWARAGHLQPVSDRPLRFTRENAISLKKHIQTNSFSRLRRRANRSALDKHTAVETLDRDLADVIPILLKANPDPAKALFSAALAYLLALGEAAPPAGDGDFATLAWRRRSVETVMRDWHARIGGAVARAPLAAATASAWASRDDPLGQIYQGMSPEGVRAASGAYFTPGGAIDASLAALPGNPESFLDPCCGTGRYLVGAAKRFGLDIGRLHGFDADPTAVDLARLNLLLALPDADDAPDILCLDSLRDLATGAENCATNGLIGAVDAIATNPPWGGDKMVSSGKTPTAILSGESFSLFLEQSLRLLRVGGAMSLLLPQSVLQIRAHADVRRLILENARIAGITFLGRIFAGVFTDVVRLDLVKTAAPPDWEVTVDRSGEKHRVRQKRFAANVHHAFDATVTHVDEYLLEKIHSIPHTTLAGNAEWAMGIVTGDNRRHVLDTPQSGSEPILRGRDVFRFAAREARSHIIFRPETFQQAAPERLYRAPEKLIYRFVSDSLVFAYDDRGLLTLNSANILIPRLPDMPIKAVLAFLNSSVFQYLFVKRFQTRKVLRGDLETLPFPLLDGKTTRALVKQVDLCMSGSHKPAAELNHMIYNIFTLTAAAAQTLEEHLASPRP